MTIFRIEGTVTSSTQAELLTTMNWFAANYGSKMGLGEASGADLTLRFGIDEDTYSNMSSTMSALQTEFGARLESSWRVTYIR